MQKREQDAVSDKEMGQKYKMETIMKKVFEVHKNTVNMNLICWKNV